MSEYKELIVLSTAKQGLKSLAQSSIRSFCLARDLMLPRVSVISFVVDAEPESVPYLGVYKASTGERITYSNELLPCSGMSEEGYRISYKTESVIEVADELGFIFAFYDDIPAQKYYSSPGTVDVVVRNGALLDDTADTVWAISDSVKTPQMPYVELSSGVLYTVEGEIDCTYSYTPFDDVGENGVVIVSVLGNTKFDGSFINTDAGVITYKVKDSEALHSSKTNAVAVRSSMTPNSATDQLEIGRLQNLYIEDGWMPLLTFKLPDNWQWDVCSIKPNDRNEYKLCGRISNGTLEWQFGNLVSATTTPATAETYEKWVYNKETGAWESVIIDPEVGGSSSSTPAEALNGFIETVAYKDGSFNTPVLGWAGEEESKKTMLKEGKLIASCEPVYLGMFNLSMSYLAGIEYNIVNDSDCDQTCDAADNQYYYEAVQEVSPVWFLFASTKNDLLNIVAIEHKLSEGETDGTGQVPAGGITNPYTLYGPPPKLLGKSLDDKPPVSYENFRIWLYTNFILPPESDIYDAPGTNPKLPAGHYYVHTVEGRHFYRIPDELFESGCRSTPSPMWMREHSVIDTDDDNAVEVPLCTVGEDNSVSVFNNTNKGYRGFIDNVLDHEYRWQRVNNSWDYVPYTASSYVADINKTEGIAFNTQAYLPVGSRYSKSYASYTNYVFRLSSVGRCLKFETANVSDSVGDSIVGDGTYVISVPGGIEYTSSVFKRIEEAPAEVEVNSITVTKGSTLAYDTPPKYNIADISVFDGYIGDGNIAVTGAGTANDSENIVLDGVPLYNTPRLIAPGFILSDRRVVGGAESGVMWYADGATTLPSSTYTGTLILQGRNIPAIDLTSFSNVILDQAVIHPIKASEFGNVTVPNDTAGVITFPEEVKVVCPVFYPFDRPTSVYVIESIQVVLANGDFERFGKDITSRTVYAFAQYVNVVQNRSGVVFGQGNGNDVEKQAGLIDTEIPELKTNLKLTSRPGGSNQYAGIFYPITTYYAPSKLRLSFDVEYPNTTIYPISYSVWLPYYSNVTIDGVGDAVCLVNNTLLDKDDLHTVVDIDVSYWDNYDLNWVLVLFVTSGDTASNGVPVYVKNILMEATYDSSNPSYTSAADRFLGVTTDSSGNKKGGSVHIKNLHVDESGKFAFCSGRYSTITVDSLEGTGTVGIGVVPEGYFKDTSTTNQLQITNTEQFTGLYYLGEGISQFNISDDYKITPNRNASLAVRGSFRIMDYLSTIADNVNSIYLSTVILENNSSLSTGGYGYDPKAGLTMVVDKLVIGNDAVVEMITDSANCTTAGSFTVAKTFNSGRTVIRGTVVLAAGFFSNNTINTLDSTFVVNLHNGLDNFEPVAVGTDVYVAEVLTGAPLSPPATDGEFITVLDNDAYYYAIKGDVVESRSTVYVGSELITTAEEPEGATAKFFRTVDGSVVFTLPKGYDPLTSTSTNSDPIAIDEFADIIEGKMDFAVNDRYMDLTTWTDVDRLSRYYVKEVNDPNNTCYEVEVGENIPTLTCCEIPEDCCETDPSDPSNCNKNCGTPPPPYPDGNINIPEFGDATGGGNENNNKDNIDGNAPEGSKLPDWSYPPGDLYISQEQVYLYSVQGALKGTYTEEEVLIKGTRGTTSTATFHVPSHSLKLAFDDVVNNVEVQGAGDSTAELEGEMTFPVTFTMNDDSYRIYDDPSDNCSPVGMTYGMTSLTSTGANRLSLGVIYNSMKDGGQKGELTYTGNIKMPIEDIEVVVKISDTFEVGPTQAPESIESELTAMGLRWEKIASEVKTIYTRNTADYARIRFNYISIYPAANFRGRVISSAIPSANFKCRGKCRGSIAIGSDGWPAEGPTIEAEATSGISGDVRMWRKDGTGLDQPLTLNTELMVTNYKMADTLITSSESLENAEWEYCDYYDGGSAYTVRTAHGTASGQIIVEGELLNG